ncbi:hypothetical protein AAFF_G00065310 [Aldrovandia affinis]|uniref:Uncharacterized protein n=1 Tax=Aldrovandia affinis TaxID=143900 RepID=A0AAD7T414_9TELE|nr:hypothetical protein AAFF_G00065310 [Aldrovandia affinis]
MRILPASLQSYGHHNSPDFLISNTTNTIPMPGSNLFGIMSYGMDRRCAAGTAGICTSVPTLVPWAREKAEADPLYAGGQQTPCPHMT